MLFQPILHAGLDSVSQMCFWSCLVAYQENKPSVCSQDPVSNGDPKGSSHFCYSLGSELTHHLGSTLLEDYCLISWWGSGSLMFQEDLNLSVWPCYVCWSDGWSVLGFLLSRRREVGVWSGGHFDWVLSNSHNQLAPWKQWCYTDLINCEWTASGSLQTL